MPEGPYSAGCSVGLKASFLQHRTEGLLLARIFAPGIPGLLFKGSIDQVQGICSSGLGAMAQAANAAAAHSCSDASTAMTVLNIAMVAGILLLIAGGVDLLLRAVRQAQHAPGQL